MIAYAHHGGNREAGELPGDLGVLGFGAAGSNVTSNHHHIGEWSARLERVGIHHVPRIVGIARLSLGLGTEVKVRKLGDPKHAPNIP